MNPHWLLLLSLSLEVMAGPIKPNPNQQEVSPPKEEIQDENAVKGSLLFTMLCALIHGCLWSLTCDA